MAEKTFASPARHVAIPIGLLLISAALLATARAAPEQFVIDSHHTYTSFEVRYLFVSTQHGRFNRTTGKAIFDPAAETGSLDIHIDARSISAGGERLERFLRGEDFFNVDHFPDIAFQSTSMRFADGKPHTIAGRLTLLGVTRPLTLTVLYYGCTPLPRVARVACDIDAVTTLRRSEFGMTSVPGFVADEVKLLVQAAAVREEAPRANEFQ